MHEPEQRGAFGRHPKLGAPRVERGRSPIRPQRFKELAPLVDGRQGDERQQGVVQFVGIAHDGPLLGRDFIDRRGVEQSDAVGGGAAGNRTQLNGSRASLLERGVIEVCVWIGVEDLV